MSAYTKYKSTDTDFALILNDFLLSKNGKYHLGLLDLSTAFIYYRP